MCHHVQKGVIQTFWYTDSRWEKVVSPEKNQISVAVWIQKKTFFKIRWVLKTLNAIISVRRWLKMTRLPYIFNSIISKTKIISNLLDTIVWSLLRTLIPNNKLGTLMSVLKCKNAPPEFFKSRLYSVSPHGVYDRYNRHQILEYRFHLLPSYPAWSSTDFHWVTDFTISGCR